MARRCVTRITHQIRGNYESQGPYDADRGQHAARFHDRNCSTLHERERHRHLPVGDKDNLLGVITDRDITIRVTAAGLDPKHTTLREVITPGCVHVFDDQDMEDACLHMIDNHVRRLVVFNRSRDLVGVLSLDDVAVKTTKEKLTGHVLAKVAKRVPAGTL